MKGKVTEVLLGADRIDRRVTALAEEISADYTGKTIHVICLLKGSLIFTADLVRRIDGQVVLHVMRASSYAGTKSSGSVQILYDVDSDISGEHVLVLEDIVDTGRTLKLTLEMLQSRHPASLKVCTLLDKPSRRVIEDLTIQYKGFTIEDHFVVGYGLDLDERYRELPFIGIFDPNG